MIDPQGEPPDRHGVYRDGRQSTGYCWYCPRQDWRYPSLEPDESMWLYCPGCGRIERVNVGLREEAAP